MPRLAPLALLALLSTTACEEDWSDTPGIDQCEFLFSTCGWACSEDGCEGENWEACTERELEGSLVEERYPGLASRAARVAAQGAMSCEDMLTGVDAFQQGFRY